MAVYDFSFVVGELTEEQAGTLFDIIISFAEGFNAEVAGGFSPAKEEGPHGEDPVGQEL